MLFITETKLFVPVKWDWANPKSKSVLNHPLVTLDWNSLAFSELT